MHEAGVAQAIVRIAKESAQGAGAGKIFSVQVEIGDLRAVEDESLRFFFEIFAKGTALEGAKLEIEHIPIRAYCTKCRRNIEVERTIFACPLCGSFQISPLGGQELRVRSIEVENEDKGNEGGS